MASRIHAPSSLLLIALAGCGAEMESTRAEGLTLSRESVAAVEAQIVREGEAAAGDPVGLVVASPVGLHDGELDRLGRLMIERSDGELCSPCCASAPWRTPTTRTWPPGWSASRSTSVRSCAAST